MNSIALFELSGVKVIPGPECSSQWDPPEGVMRMDWELSPDGRHVLREAYNLPEEDRLNRERLIVNEARLWEENGWASFQEAADLIREALRVGYRIRDVRKAVEQSGFETIRAILQEARMVEFDPGIQEVPGSYFETDGEEEDWETSAWEDSEGRFPLAEDVLETLRQARKGLAEIRVQEEVARRAESYTVHGGRRDWAVHPVKPENPTREEEVHTALVKLKEAGKGLPLLSRDQGKAQAEALVGEMITELFGFESRNAVRWLQSRVIPRLEVIEQLTREAQKAVDCGNCVSGKVGYQLYTAGSSLKEMLKDTRAKFEKREWRKVLFVRVLSSVVDNYIDRAWSVYHQAKNQ